LTVRIQTLSALALLLLPQGSNAPLPFEYLTVGEAVIEFGVDMTLEESAMLLGAGQIRRAERDVLFDTVRYLAVADGDSAILELEADSTSIGDRLFGFMVRRIHTLPGQEWPTSVIAVSPLCPVKALRTE
jgi:hypothetical protein